MSMLQILTIIRNHSGVHASDTVKITHKEVMTMIRGSARARRGHHGRAQSFDRRNLGIRGQRDSSGYLLLPRRRVGTEGYYHRRVNSILKAEVMKAGSKFDPQPAWLNITALQRNGGTYGYMCTAGWLNNKNGGYWVADFYADQNGDTLVTQSDYEPPDDE